MAKIGRAADFAVYVLTYPGDLHMSTVLVRSIRQLNPDVPIVIIPGEGLARSTPTRSARARSRR